VVDYGQYAVKALALGEACDQIHHNLSKGRCIFRDHDFIKWGAGFVHEVLVLLADSAALYILLNLGSCSRLEIVVVNLSNHLVPSSVPPCFVVMPYPQDFMLNFIIWRDYQPISWVVLPYHPI